MRLIIFEEDHLVWASADPLPDLDKNAYQAVAVYRQMSCSTLNAVPLLRSFSSSSLPRWALHES